MRTANVPHSLLRDQGLLMQTRRWQVEVVRVEVSTVVEAGEGSEVREAPVVAEAGRSVAQVVALREMRCLRQGSRKSHRSICPAPLTSARPHRDK